MGFKHNTIKCKGTTAEELASQLLRTEDGDAVLSTHKHYFSYFAKKGEIVVLVKGGSNKYPQSMF